MSIESKTLIVISHSKAVHHSSKEVEAQQRAVDVVHEWSKGWKINLNGTKSELSTFSMSNADSSWRPNITINGTAVRFEPHPRLLGVILDRRLTFGSQVAAVKRKANSKIGLLNAVAHSKWGWRKKDLRKVYLAHFRSVLTFASSAWQPWLPDTRVAELERVQNKCLRLSTGQGKSTPVEALRLEANVPSLASVIAANCLRCREKALRLPVNHPRRLALEEVAPRRLKSRQRDFRQTSERWSESCGLSDLPRIPLTYFGVRPWERGLPPDIVFPFLEGVSGREDPQHIIQQARTKAVYAALTQSREDLLGCRADQTLVARLRSGYYIGLRATQHRFNENLSGTCNLCGEGSQDLEHWIDCPATAAERHALFGEYSGGLDCLTRFPREAATLARKTLGENLKPPSP